MTKTQTAQSKLSRSFLQPTLKLVRDNGGVETVRDNGSLAPVVYLVGRQHCNFSRIRLPAANKSGLEAARMKARQQQRFSNIRMRIDQDRDDPRDAGLWTWSGDQSVEDGKPITTRRCLPETIARLSLQEGARLVICGEGVEGEIWHKNVLTASRWWPSTPSARDWQLFLRAGKHASSDGAQSVPAAQHVPWRDDIPLLDRDPDNLALTFAPAKVAAMVAGLLGLLFAFQIGQGITYSVRIQNAQTKLSTAVQDNREGYRLRAAALGSQANIAASDDLENPVLMLHVLTALSTTITEDIGDITNIRIGDTGIEVFVRVTEVPDFPSLARNLERSTYLEDVSVESTNAAFFTVKASIPEGAGAIDLFLSEPPDRNDGDKPAASSEPESTQKSSTQNNVAIPQAQTGASNNG